VNNETVSFFRADRERVNWSSPDVLCPTCNTMVSDELAASSPVRSVRNFFAGSRVPTHEETLGGASRSAFPARSSSSKCSCLLKREAML